MAFVSNIHHFYPAPLDLKQGFDVAKSETSQAVLVLHDDHGDGWISKDGKQLSP